MTDLIPLLQAALSADIIKFVVVCLLVLLVYIVRTLVKTVAKWLESNTAAASVVQKQISELTDKLTDVKNTVSISALGAKEDVIKAVAKLDKELDALRLQIGELNIRLGNVNQYVDQKLSGAKTVESAIEVRIAKLEMDWNEFNKMLSEAKRRRGQQ